MNNFNLDEEQWRQWYRMSPAERWRVSEELWEFYLSCGGSLDPESDSQSPFRDAFFQSAFSAHGRTGVHILRRV